MLDIVLSHAQAQLARSRCLRGRLVVAQPSPMRRRCEADENDLLGQYVWGDNAATTAAASAHLGSAPRIVDSNMHDQGSFLGRRYRRRRHSGTARPAGWRPSEFRSSTRDYFRRATGARLPLRSAHDLGPSTVPFGVCAGTFPARRAGVQSATAAFAQHEEVSGGASKKKKALGGG